MEIGRLQEKSLSPPPRLAENWPLASSPRVPAARRRVVDGAFGVFGRAFFMMRFTVTAAAPPCSAEAPRRISMRSSSPEGMRPTVVSA